MAPSDGMKLFDYMIKQATLIYPHVAAGQFGAYMQVHLCNDGPMTFILSN